MLMRPATRLMDDSSCFSLSSAAARDAALGKEGRAVSVGMAFLRMPAVMSLGRSTRTGPGRPLVAISKASLILRGSSAMFLTMTFHLVQAREMPTTSASWKASLPMAVVGTWPQKDDHGGPVGEGVLHGG